jgi:signal transduction histidine kinase
MINLLANAVKFTTPGGLITVTVSHDSGDGYMFKLIDTGIGIALEDIPKIMAPFQQIDGDLNRKYVGTGFGLSLTKSFIELHGGSLELESEIGVGTTATVRFPAERIILQSAAITTTNAPTESAAV